ncbi:hypothetical protein MD588_10715 [Photobacterium sp. SDRW27]|uniref:hypothetical protein n=1 Tax=Photobacterium obscurum TaxID=2829490 RepID=UPI002243FA55|nr:hypothetical protein [Photobacterium obscurum]MCW8329277.1 hypothetical protein [Photobacterium obscurum]
MKVVGVLLIAVAGMLVLANAKADTLLMSYAEYMDRCMNTYGADKLTKSVCEAQYRAMEKKEQELMAQASAEPEKTWTTELPGNNPVDR